MSSMTLIRHGQASFFAADYDRLSSLGEEQSRSLGRYWADRGCRFDQVYAGPRLRQQQTAQLIGESFRQAGIDWPDPIVLSELDEYDLKGLKEHLAPALIDRDSNFA
ncbi:MAG: phosphoglycerate mutase family protein, partial [Pirellula sp.]